MFLLHNAPAQPMCRSCVRVSFECGSVFVSRAARQALALLRACIIVFDRVLQASKRSRVS